eukprot:4619945-Amphidinium_carterae.1
MKVQLKSVINPCIYATDATTTWGAVTKKVASVEEALFMWSRKRPRHARMWTCPDGYSADLLMLEPGSSVLERPRDGAGARDNAIGGASRESRGEVCCARPKAVGEQSGFAGRFPSDCACAAAWAVQFETTRSDDDGSRTSLVPLWVHTSCNPADDPTRGQRVRRARKRSATEEEMLAKAAVDHPMALFCLEQALKRGEKEFDSSLGPRVPWRRTFSTWTAEGRQGSDGYSATFDTAQI